MMTRHNIPRYPKAFTIVELLVVIVVIGILAAITIVSYSGISSQAVVASIKSDLTNSSKLFKLFQAEKGLFPATVTNCAVSPDMVDNKCIKPSSNNTFDYYTDTNRQSFVLYVKNGTNVYQITENSEPVAWLTLGTQVWSPTNLNVGIRIAGATNPTNEGAGSQVIQKYCHGDSELNCTTYGALYQWDEAMQYVTTSGARGICPLGSHIPTTADFNTLVSGLGGGPTAGGQLKSGGSSGLNFPLAGYMSGGSFFGITSSGFYMSSSESGANADVLAVSSSDTIASRPPQAKTRGISVRCIKD